MCRRSNKSKNRKFRYKKRFESYFETINLENKIEDCRISRVAIECVDTGENTNRRRQQSGYILTLKHETLGSNED